MYHKEIDKLIYLRAQIDNAIDSVITESLRVENITENDIDKMVESINYRIEDNVYFIKKLIKEGN